MIGVSAALVSALCSAAKDVVSKRLSFNVDGTVSTFASFVYALPYYLLLLSVSWLLGYETFAVSSSFFVWILARSISDAFAEWFKMHALQHGDLSVVSSLLSLYPVILLVTSPLITGDKLSLHGALGVIVTIAGTLVILYKPRNAESGVNRRAVLYALGAACCFSLNSCFDRLAVQTASPALSGFVMTLLAALFILPLMRARPGRFGELMQYRKLFLERGFFEISFMVIKLYALQHLQAPYVVGIQRVSVLFSVLGGKVVFKEKHFVRRMLGALMIVAGVVWIVLEQVSSRP